MKQLNEEIKDKLDAIDSEYKRLTEKFSKIECAILNKNRSLLIQMQN